MNSISGHVYEEKYTNWSNGKRKMEMIKEGLTSLEESVRWGRKLMMMVVYTIDRHF